MARRANAQPTKEFFIWMLVKDIPLTEAILDLVDNAVDGARRTRLHSQDKSSRFEGLQIEIFLTGDHFAIHDNCGGIPIELAEQYAFRFGRPQDMPPTPESIGQFGVGMKRALFKLGQHFTIRSIPEDGLGFQLDVDVDKWRQQPDWEFVLEDAQPRSDETPGTQISVQPLHDTVRDVFKQQAFHNEVAAELAKRHQPSLSEGLSIVVNGVPVGLAELKLLHSSSLRPAYARATLFEEDPNPVQVQLYAGLGPSGQPRDGGWYIYCNGRLVVGPDQTSLTVWGVDDGDRIPRYHNQFSRFRGYAFFASADAARLPWTTTKAGIDTNSEVYRWARQRMIRLSRPVIDFLNELDREKEGNVAPGRPSLEALLHRASETPLPKLNPQPKFQFPKPKRTKTPPNEQNITYRKPTHQIDRIKRLLQISTNREVGERTFDYFYDRECEE